jgi:DNA topoisomerase-1
LTKRLKEVDPKGFRPPAVSTGAKCTVCKKGEIVEREGRFGKFYGCNAYPNCKSIFTRDDNGDFKLKESSPVKETGEQCHRCSKGKIVEKKGQYGAFFACNNYPACKTIYLQDSNGVFVIA